nr:hypothetical protein [Tanacetum cinerariifolium]
MYRDKYEVQMMMRFTEIHKFSDGTLQQIDEPLDYKVKEFRINRINPEAFEDKEDLPQPRELCWWTRQRGRLQTTEAEKSENKGRVRTEMELELEHTQQGSSYEVSATASIKKANDVVKFQALIDRKKVVITEDVIRQDLCLDDTDGAECLPNEEIFAELACMGYEKPPLKLTFYKAFFSSQWKFLIHTLVQCRKFNFSKYIFDSMVRNVDSPTKFLMVGKGFSGVETPLFASMLVQPQAVEVEEDVEVHAAPTPPSPTNTPSPPSQDPIPTPPQAQPATPSSPTQEQPTRISKSFMTLLNTFLETYATLSQKVVALEQDKHTQPLEIIKLKKRVKKRMHPNRGKIEAIDADQDINLVDVETQEEVANMDDELQGRIDNVSAAATKDVNVVEPTVFDDDEVTMTMAQTLIKMKAKKSRLLDEQIAKRLHDEEVEKAAAKKKQEKDDLEKAKGLQQQYDDKQENIDWNVIFKQIQEKHLDNIRKYQSLKRKPVSIAQARKNMIIYLKNMAGYKMEHSRGMTYDKVKPIFERECNKFQTLFKPDKDVEEPQKKRVLEETLLQESFKKLKAVEVLGSESTQETPTNDPKEMSEEDVQNMLEIVPVSEFKVESLQVKYPLIDWEIHSEGSSILENY